MKNKKDFLRSTKNYFRENTMKFRPCIDIHSGKVKQIVGSTLSDGPQKPHTNFETDLPTSYYAQMYKKDNLSGGHVIMLGSGNEAAAKDALSVYPGGLQIGGGITTENARKYLEYGASHVIVTSYVFKDGLVYWDRLRDLKNAIGKKHLVLDLSCKKQNGNYYVVTDRWQKFTDTVLSQQTFESLADFCDEFLIHAADVEGKKAGIDEELVVLLGHHVSIPTTYAGGVRSLDDLEQIKKLGNGLIDVTIGSALDIFGGELSYESVVKWFKQK
jgi:phosphoribosylformimino-5-aminoimidazole carboxamide ribotide isomerase